MKMVEPESKTDILVNKYFPQLKKKKKKSMEWLNRSRMKMLSAEMVIWEEKALPPKYKAMRQKK